jgi:hypothetical protein
MASSSPVLTRTRRRLTGGSGSDRTRLLRSSSGTTGEPSLRLPTAEKLFGAVSVMMTVCGNACAGGSCCRPGLLLCGLRRVAGADHERLGRTVGDVQPRREEIFLDRDPARVVVRTNTTDQELVDVEVVHLDPMVLSGGQRVALPPQTNGCGDLRGDIPQGSAAPVESVTLPTSDPYSCCAVTAVVRARSWMTATTVAR